ncbi:MAG: ABC transporter permease [Actinomycetota bacterium]|nr:ABC transporter permease [Actinomycetota bacterium]
MRLREGLWLALRGLVAHPLRTALTMLGVFIGSAAVISLIAVGQGAQASITSRVASLGTNLLSVTPGGQIAGTLSPGDASAIGSLPGVSAVAPELSISGAPVVLRTTETSAPIVGTTSSAASVRDLQMVEGSFLSQQEVTRGLQVAVLGSLAASDLGKTPGQLLGRTVDVDGVPFRVIGVLASKGGSTTSADNVVYAPITTVEAHFANPDGVFLSAIGISVAPKADMTTVAAEVQQALRSRHELPAGSPNDFTLFDQAQLLSVAVGNSLVLRNFLIGIAAIALLVGGIGIANIMLVTVRERTREIGIRKAIGARRSDIGLQFLAEAVLVSLGGGALGAAAGSLAAPAVGHLVHVTATASPGAVVVAFVASVVVGVLAGWLPARQAAILEPLTALRAE